MSVKKALIRYVGKEAEGKDLKTMLDMAQEKAEQSAAEGNGPTLTSKEIMQGLGIHEKIWLVKRVYSNMVAPEDLHDLNHANSEMIKKTSLVNRAIIPGMIGGVASFFIIASIMYSPLAAGLPLSGFWLGASIGSIAGSAIAYAANRIVSFLTGIKDLEAYAENRLPQIEYTATQNIRLAITKENAEKGNEQAKKEFAKMILKPIEPHQVTGIQAGLNDDGRKGNVR